MHKLHKYKKGITYHKFNHYIMLSTDSITKKAHKLISVSDTVINTNIMLSTDSITKKAHKLISVSDTVINTNHKQKYFTEFLIAKS